MFVGCLETCGMREGFSWNSGSSIAYRGNRQVGIR